MIGEKKRKKKIEVEAVPLDGDSVFDSPEGELSLQKGNLVALPAVSGAVEPEVVYDDEVAAMDTTENRECLERVKRNLQHFYNQYWNLARDIYDVNSTRIYRLAGYQNFDDYVTTELDFTKRTADYLVKVHKYFAYELKALLADQPEVYAEIIEAVKTMGWTKAEKIAKKRILTSENAKALFEKFTKPNTKGRQPSVTEIESIVETEFHNKQAEKRADADHGDAPKSDKDKEATVNKRFVWSVVQANTVLEAMDIAKGICPAGSTEPTQLAWVCAEFVESYGADRGKEIDLSKMLAKYEEMLGIDLIGVDRVTGTVKYGGATAQALRNTPS